jgi:G3E family GTPase
VATINSYAQMQASTYSKVNLDFVLNTHSYEASDTALQSSTTISFLSCLPCDSTVHPMENGSKMSQRPALAALGGVLSTAGHIPTEMRTQYFKIPGDFNLKKLQVALDAMLYSGVSAGTTTHINKTETADKDSAKESHSTAAESRDMRIFRMKGLVHIANKPNLYILQAVHTIFDVQPSECAVGGEQDTTAGLSVFVVIGKFLDADLIEAELVKCLQSP